MTLERHMRKWDRLSSGLDWTGKGIERRYGGIKRELFARSRGRVLLVAAGTGLDFPQFPAGLDITAVDFSPAMLARAREKAAEYPGSLKLVRGDIMDMGMKGGSFDTIVTSCTFCSVPDPVRGLRELRRLLKDDGRLLMFEHVRAGNFFLGLMMDVMTPVTRLFGPELNRRTWDNLRNAGFAIKREVNVYLDVVKIYEAEKK